MQLPAGVSVGHWTDPIGMTGCTVILTPEGAVAGVDVRGGAPGTLGTDALAPGRVAPLAHAVLMTGGSAFGLAAVDGVMRYLEDRDIGFALGPVRVPIVGGAVIFDLLYGESSARPDAAAGYAACLAATAKPGIGAVGVGAGATVAKAGGGADTRPGGLGIASMRVHGATVTAVTVANSVGGIWDDERHEWVAPLTSWDRTSNLLPGANTTLATVVTDASLTKDQAHRVATVAHGGLARAVRPAHTMYDGDTIFCLATGAVEVPYDAVEVLAADLVARALALGVRAAQQ